MNDFDKRFSQTEKTIDRTFKAIVVIWIIGAVVSLAAMAGIVYAAWHFISKYW